MPNLKIHVDTELLARHGDRLHEALPALRDLLCAELAVQPDVCQLAVLCVRGLADQPAASVEIMMLAKPDRTHTRIAAVCEKVRLRLAEILDTQVAVRASAFDPQSYVTIR